MISVIIAGGSGTRLWPLSTPGYPKHLLALTGSKSLLNYTYDRAKKLGKTVYVVPDGSHAHHVTEQLSELSEDAFIVEPGRRGTASCIIAALSVVARHHDHDEPIAFMAADHYIRDTAGFAHSFKSAAEVSKASNRIVLVGIEPDYPATGFGYIEKDGLYDEKRFIFNVKTFKEKPDYETAKKYLASGQFLWNSGYFVGSVNTFVKAMEESAPELLASYQKLLATKDRAEFEKVYLDLENDTIDYALIEKVPDLLVVPATFDWMDLGSYGDLQKAVGSDQQGNYIKGDSIEVEGVENSLVHNHEDKPVAVIGLDNIVVVNTKDGILVARKDLAQKVGEVSKRFNNKDAK